MRPHRAELEQANQKYAAVAAFSSSWYPQPGMIPKLIYRPPGYKPSIYWSIKGFFVCLQIDVALVSKLAFSHVFKTMRLYFIWVNWRGFMRRSTEPCAAGITQTLFLYSKIKKNIWGFYAIQDLVKIATSAQNKSKTATAKRRESLKRKQL